MSEAAAGPLAEKDAERGAEGAALARGAAASSVALVAANFRALFTLLIARLLGNAVLGTFSLAFALNDLLSRLATFGLDYASTALVARRRSQGGGGEALPVVASSLRIGVVASVGTAAVAIPAMLLLGPRLGQAPALVQASAVIFLALPGIALYRIANGISRGYGVMRHDIYSRGLAETWTTILVLLVAYASGLRALAPVLAVVAGTAAGAVVALRLARSLHGETAGVGRSADREVAAFAAPIAGYGLLNILIMRLDVLVLGACVGRAPGLTLGVFGVYCAAVEVTGGLRKVRQVFEPAFAPRVAVESAAAASGLVETMAQTGRWVLAGVLPLVGLCVVSGRLVLGVFGSSFREGAVWLAVLAVAQGVSALAGLAEIVIMVRRPTLNLVNSSLTALAQLVLTVLLVRRLGALGAALATLAAYALMAALRFLELQTVFRRPWPWASLLRPLLAFGVSFLPALAVRLAVSGPTGDVAAGLLLLAGYVLAWRLLGLDPADRAALDRLLGR